MSVTKKQKLASYTTASRRAVPASRAQKPAASTRKPTAKIALAKVAERPVAQPAQIISVRSLAKPRVVVGFVDFLREQSVVGLAVGLVIGTQVKALADQLISSFINPLLGLVLPGTGALNSKVFTLHVGHKAATFAWGAFVAVSLSFLTTAAVVYFVFKALKLDTLTKKKDA